MAGFSKKKPHPERLKISKRLVPCSMIFVHLKECLVWMYLCRVAEMKLWKSQNSLYSWGLASSRPGIFRTEVPEACDIQTCCPHQPHGPLASCRDPRRRAPNCIRPTGATRRHIVSPGAFAANLADGSAVTRCNIGSGTSSRSRPQNLQLPPFCQTGYMLYSPDLGVFTFWWQQLCSSR